MMARVQSFLRPIGRCWVATGPYGAPNYDEFAGCDDVRAMVAARPDSIAAVDNPQCFAGLDAARDQLRLRQQDGRYARHDGAVLLYDLGGVRAVVGLVDSAEISSARGEPGRLLRNEEVFGDKVAERRELIEGLRTLISPVLLVPDGPGLPLPQGFPTAAPLVDETDESGVRHRLWLVEDPAAMLAALAERTFFVADGNHRSLASQQAGVPCLAVIADPAALTIEPYHRLLELSITGAELVGQTRAWNPTPVADLEAGRTHLYADGRLWLLDLPSSRDNRRIDSASRPSLRMISSAASTISFSVRFGGFPRLDGVDVEDASLRGMCALRSSRGNQGSHRSATAPEGRALETEPFQQSLVGQRGPAEEEGPGQCPAEDRVGRLGGSQEFGRGGGGSNRGGRTTDVGGGGRGRGIRGARRVLGEGVTPQRGGRDVVECDTGESALECRRIDEVVGMSDEQAHYPLDEADLFGGQGGCGEVDCAQHQPPAGALDAQESGGRVREIDLRQRPTRVHDVQRRHGDAGGRGVHREERGARRRSRNDEGDVGAVGCRYELLDSRDLPTVLGIGGAGLDHGRIPRPRLLGGRKCASDRARGDLVGVVVGCGAVADHRAQCLPRPTRCCRRTGTR